MGNIMTFQALQAPIALSKNSPEESRKRQASWLLAGGMGAAGAAIRNDWSSSRAAWGVPPQHRDAAAGVVVVQPGRP
jgi:hypothetical protein